MSRVRKRVLIGTSTAPILATAKKMKRYSGRLHEPETDVVTRLDSRGNQAPGDAVGLIAELGE